MKVFHATQTSEITEEAANLFHQAVEVLQSAGQALNNDDRKDAAAILLLSISKAGAPFTLAHSMLAMLYYELGEVEATRTHVSKTLEHDPLNFRAQFVNVQLAADELHELKKKARDNKDDFAVDTWESESNEIFTLQLRFHEKVNRLIEVFHSLCQQGLHAIEFLYFAHQMIALGEFIQTHTYSKFSRSPNVYAAIVSAKIDNLIYDEDATKERRAIDEVRLLAQGM